MKKMKLTLFASVLTFTLVSSSAFAIYTGEEQEEPKEGQPYTMTKIISEPSVSTEPTEDVQATEANAEVEPVSTITEKPESLIEPREVEEVKEESDNIALYVVAGLIALLALSVLLLKRKK